MVARLVAVFDVVVDQREVVHQLDGDGDGQGLLEVAAEGFAGQEAEGGSQALGEVGHALCGPAEVVAQHLVEGGVVVRQGPADLALDRVTVAIEDIGAGSHR